MKTQTRETWLTEALEMMRELGLGGIKVEGLGRRLGVTSGSFYHHFESLDDLLETIPPFWMQRARPATEAVMRSWGDTLEEALRYMLCEYIPYEGRMRYDAVMRSWGRTNADTKKACERVDRRRFAAATRLFEMHGVESEEARARGALVYFMLLGLYQICDTPDCEPAGYSVCDPPIWKVIVHAVGESSSTN